VRVLAQVASALAATHAVQAVHRDVQGESVLVREDGSAVLVGFGGGEAHSEAGAAEDVYALGVMAWQLVEGRSAEAVSAPEELGKGEWLRQPVRRAPQALGGAGRELKGLILRMLSPEPLARGSAAEVVQALQRAEKKAGSQAERPLRASPEAVWGVRSAWAVAVEWMRERRVLLVAAAALVLAVGVWRVERQQLGGRAVELAQPTLEDDGRDAGTAELADTAVSGSESAKEGREPKPGGFRLEVPKDPRPGQLRPPCKPPRVVINGGCWGHLIGERPPCGDGAYEWGDGCYWPVMTTSRKPTSEPR
jgi:hypothetical protein